VFKFCKSLNVKKEKNNEKKERKGKTTFFPPKRKTPLQVLIFKCNTLFSAYFVWYMNGHEPREKARLICIQITCSICCFENEGIERKTSGYRRLI
jgi:hypothetical protein